MKEKQYGRYYENSSEEAGLWQHLIVEKNNTFLFPSKFSLYSDTEAKEWISSEDS